MFMVAVSFGFLCGRETWSVTVMKKHHEGAEESLGTWKRNNRKLEKSFVGYQNEI
jgi:tagatose-1,6-bisphosphate aldolase